MVIGLGCYRQAVPMGRKSKTEECCDLALATDRPSLRDQGHGNRAWLLPTGRPDGTEIQDGRVL
jgi:hypothetical protein